MDEDIKGDIDASRAGLDVCEKDTVVAIKYQSLFSIEDDSLKTTSDIKTVCLSTYVSFLIFHQVVRPPKLLNFLKRSP